MSTVLVDARNVQRSQWPNLTDEELIERARAWAERHDADLMLVFDGQALGGVGPQRLDERTTLVGTGDESADDEAAPATPWDEASEPAASRRTR